MHCIHIVQTISLVFVIAYYGVHNWHDFHHSWQTGRRKLTDAQDWRAIVAVTMLLMTSGCIQSGPFVFYGSHLISEIVEGVTDGT